jgi:cation transport regulator ChaC
MDAHHDIVMRARLAAPEGTRRYFAYSTILDRPAFEEWRGQHGYAFFELPRGEVAEALDVRLTYDFPSRWWGGRVAGLADAPGASVWGVLFEVSEKDWPIVQHKEGAITGMSVERRVTVRLAEATLTATAFATNPERTSADGPVSRRFVEALVRGASGAGLPKAWIDSVERSAAG